MTGILVLELCCVAGAGAWGNFRLVNPLFAAADVFPLFPTLVFAGLLTGLLLAILWLKRSALPRSGKREACLAALKLAAVYLAFSGVWILASDSVVQSLVRSPERLMQIQTHKGLAFVVLSAVLIGGLVCWHSMRTYAADALLRQSEERFRNLVENARDLIFSISPDGKVLSLNPAFESVTGWPRSRWLGQSFKDLIHPDDLQPCLDHFRRIVSGERPPPTTFRILKGSGDYAQIEFVSSLESSDGQQAYVFGVGRDVTERKRAEAQLQLQDAALRASANAIVITDREGNVQWVNPAFTQLTGYSASEAISHTLRKVRSDRHDKAFYEKLWLTILSGNVWRGEIINRRKNGQLYTEDMTITPVRNAAGDITHFIAVKQDITAQKELEEKFMQSQKMQAVGQLAAGVAHDFNNILTVITGYVQMLGTEKLREADTREFLDQVKMAADRAAKLTRQLLAFSRKRDLRFELLDFNGLIGEMATMLRRIIGEDIQFETRLAKGLPPVQADAGMMGQVLLNLAVNARDAMPNGGKLVISTEAAKLTAAEVRQHPEARAGEFVRLSAQDTGCGMSAEVLARIFEPFFTTKGAGKGSGLGLATVRGVIKQHEGWVQVASQLGRGTTFSVFLPVAAETKPAEPEAEPGPALRGGGEKILLVEDESSVRSLAALMLRRLGYQVVEAESGVRALELLAMKPDIDLMLTDVVMPGKVNGAELAEKAAALKPNLKVIFMSGYDSEATVRQFRSLPGNEFLQKPYDPTELARLVHKCLDQR